MTEAGVIFPLSGNAALTPGGYVKVVRGERLEELRKEAGLSRAALSKQVGIHETQIFKMERGEVKSTSAEKVRHLAEVLDVPESEIAEKPAKAPIVQWAERNGVSRKRAQYLARQGQIEGARKERVPGYPEPIWVMEPDARRLPPSEAQRAAWREQWRKYKKAERQRERRRRSRKEGNS